MLDDLLNKRSTAVLVVAGVIAASMALVVLAVFAAVLLWTNEDDNSPRPAFTPTDQFPARHR